MKWLARWAALISGCSSLMVEVLWVRVVGFAEAGRAEIFASVLGTYLLGIALGAYLGRRLCFGSEQRTLRGLFWLLLASSIFDPVSIIAFSKSPQELGGLLAALPWIVGGAALKGAAFPLVHHLGSNDQSRFKGVSFSTVYVFNLAGCTIGPALMALVTLDHFSTREHFMFISAMSALTASAVAWRAGGTRLILMPCIAAPLLWWVPDPLRAKATTPEGVPMVFWMENKEGVIHSAGDGNADTVYGGNVYDGRINIDLRTNQNRIDRVHGLMLAHPAPSEALVIGVSGGSWARIIAGYPSVHTIDAVEINPAYKRMIERYPAVSPVLDDPRLNLVFDDGRRWLRRHPDKRYDVIATNSTFHWRAGATNLLSRDFMNELKGHLKPGGIVLLNTTGSADVVKTAASSFRHAYVYRNTVLMSDTDFVPTLRQGAARLFDVRLGPSIDLDPDSSEDRQLARDVAGYPLLDLDAFEQESGRRGEIVTDFNMITEYRNARK